MKATLAFLVLLLLMPAYPSEKADVSQFNPLNSVYDDFANRIAQENLPEEIENRVVKNSVPSASSELRSIDYKLLKTSIFTSGDNDIVLKIVQQYNWHKIDLIQFYVFRYEQNGFYTEKLYEEHKYFDFTTAELTGDGKNELVLITDDSGNGYTLETIRILSCLNSELSMIFDEILTAYGYLPNKRVTGNDFYTISFENRYTFVPNQNSTKDILFSTKLFEREDQILSEGQTRFVFQKTSYVPDGVYYDYAARAKEIYDAKR